MDVPTPAPRKRDEFIELRQLIIDFKIITTEFKLAYPFDDELWEVEFIKPPSSGNAIEFSNERKKIRDYWRWVYAFFESVNTETSFFQMIQLGEEISEESMRALSKNFKNFQNHLSQKMVVLEGIVRQVTNSLQNDVRAYAIDPRILDRIRQLVTLIKQLQSTSEDIIAFCEARFVHPDTVLVQSQIKINTEVINKIGSIVGRCKTNNVSN